MENNILMVAETWGRNSTRDPVNIQLTEATPACFRGRSSICLQLAAKTFWMNREKYSQSSRCSTCRRPCTQLLRNNQVSWTQRQHIWKVCECACAYINFVRGYIDVIWKQLLTPLVPNSEIKCVWYSLEEYLSLVHITCWSIAKI